MDESPLEQHPLAPPRFEFCTRPGPAPARDERRSPFPAVASRDERGGVAESWPLQRQSRIERKENVESREEKSLELIKQRSQNVFLHFLIRI
jgi:hypothetical protein